MKKKIKRISKDEVYRKTIFMIGPVGVGKSLISSELSKRNNLPVITTDVLRHCPKDLKVLEDRKKQIKRELSHCKKEVEKCGDITALERLERRFNGLQYDLRNCEREMEMRALLPNLPNYEEMGFDAKVSNFVRENFGMEAWHFYQKQFENQLLKALSEQLDFACIVDMGGGMSISLDDEYAKLDKQFRDIDEKIYEKHIDLSQVGFDKIKSALEPFQNVVALQLPDDYRESMSKASNDELNHLFVESGQNDKLAKHTVCVSNLFKEDKVNWSRVDDLCSQIESQCKINASTKDQERTK